MIETETRALLKDWLAAKKEQAEAKERAKTVAARIRHIHGLDVKVRALVHLYKMENQ